MESETTKKNDASDSIHLNPFFFDSHCHPQDDVENIHLIPELDVAGICLIGVRDIDWLALYPPFFFPFVPPHTLSPF